MGVHILEVSDSCIVPKREPDSPNGLQNLIEALHREFSSDEVCIENVTKLMSSYKSTPSDWKKFAKFDRHRYTRNLVDEGNGKFNLIILCWGEGHGSAIHDHANAHCFMKMLKGVKFVACNRFLKGPYLHFPHFRKQLLSLLGLLAYEGNKQSYMKRDAPLNAEILDNKEGAAPSKEGPFTWRPAPIHLLTKATFCTLCEVRFEWPENSSPTDTAPKMREIGRTNINTNDVCYINDSLGLHRVENPSHADTSVSLHLYSPPFDSCRVFNQQTGQSSKAQVTFWSKFGQGRNKAIQETREPDDN